MGDSKTPKDTEINDMVQSLSDWVSKQPHLPRIQDDKKLLRKFLANCKYRVQKAKEKIDTFYSGRTNHATVFTGRDPTSEPIDTVTKLCCFFPLPKRTPGGELVLITKADPNITDIIPMDFTRYVTMVLDVLLLEEDNQDFMIVIDHRGFSFQHFLKLSTVIGPLNDIVLQMYPGRFKGTHLVHVPSFIGSILVMFKKVVKPKFRDRIHVHREMDTLYDVINRDILPSDLGGKERTMEELNDLYRKKVASYQDWFKSEGNARSNEDLRPTASKDSLPIGIEGSFRKLCFD